jgi:hypothetical protein
VRGFATAIFDTESGNATTLSTFGAPDLVERLDPSSGLAPNLAFTDYNPMANTFSIDLAGLSLGGTEGQSAFVDDFAFGARTTDDGPGARSNVALIAGDMVAAGVSPALPNQARDAAGQKYDHVKWGFFFGDTDTGVTSGTRTHAHLGSFAAGRLLTEDDAVQITSQANITTAVVGYRGHMVGNVLQGGSVRTATGSFSDTFSFASRTGSVTANFDGRSLMGDSAAPTNLQAYTGSISGGGLTGELNGRFVGPAETRLSTTGTNVLAPAGMVGAFSLSGGTASDYRAVGTFAAE